MKKLFYLLFATALGLLTACEGPQGPQGPQGEKGETGATGAKGAKGDQGNANVKVADLAVYPSDWTTVTTSPFYTKTAQFTTNNIFSGEALSSQESWDGAIMVYTFANDMKTYVSLPYHSYNSDGTLDYELGFTVSTPKNSVGILSLTVISKTDVTPALYRVVWIPSAIASEQPELMKMEYTTIADIYGIEE